MTSTELKDALSRRLKKIDASSESVVHERQSEVYTVPKGDHPSSQSPDAKEMNQLYRSGWNAPAPIPRSTALPAPPMIPANPLKSEAIPRKVRERSAVPFSHCV